jgi:hypothetical protein
MKLFGEEHEVDEPNLVRILERIMILRMAPEDNESQFLELINSY